MIDFLLISTCSLGILFLFYWCLLRRELLFSFTRIFLLGSILFSLTLPFIEIHLAIDLPEFTKASEISNVQSGGAPSYPLEEAVNVSTMDSTVIYQSIIFGIYLIGALIMMARFIKNIYEIFHLRQNGKRIQYKGFEIVLSNQPIHPFSFIRTIFLNKAIFNHEEEMIIIHEGVHIKHRHSYDILFMELLMVFLWFQPILYLYRKAIGLNHEFIADKVVLSQEHLSMDYIQKILTISDHRTQFSIVSSFSYLSLKNRIKMMTRKNPSKKMIAIKTGLSAVVVVSLLITFSFSLIPNTPHTETQPFIVVIDAGHGGSDPGSTSIVGDLEKDITYSITQKLIEKLSNQSWIEVVPTRNDDVEVSLGSRVINTKGSNLFLSIHGNSHVDSNVHFKDILYCTENEYATQSLKMANKVENTLSTDGEKVRINKANYYVLKNANCPALLINVGFLSNPEDAKFLQSELGQEQIANRIYNAIKIVAR